VDLKKLEAFIDLAKKAEVSELSFESKDEKISVKFPFAGAVLAAPQVSHRAQVVDSAPAQTVAEANKNAGYKEITSPFVGTFYRSSSPGAASYVNAGDRITSGKVLCIIEAMKIMNEIESEVAGEIVEICVENESYVEFGQVLFRIKP